MDVSSIPFTYSAMNVADSSVYPSTVKASNTALVRYFEKYFLQRAISVFEFTGLPDTWPKNYFEYVLFGFGYIAIVKTDKFGVIPQNCSLSGYNVFYQPTKAVIANPLIQGIVEPSIGSECAIIRLQPDYSPILDIVNYYASMMGTLSETLAVNIFNSKLSYVIGADSKAGAETFKKLYDKIASGEPAAVTGKEMFKLDGSPAWTTFTQNVGGNYIADKLLNDMRSIINMFDSEIGIPNTNSVKKANLLTEEVMANRPETYCLSELWMENMKEGIAMANDLFGLNMAVKFRFEREVNVNAEHRIASGNV